MKSDLLQRLQAIDTPTVCNAIEVAQGKRGFANFTRQTLISSDPDNSVMVGYAVTAQISAIAPPDEPDEVIRTRRMDYYRAMAEGSKPSIAVVEDVDFPHCIGAYWGEINSTVHKGFGMNGALTNGVMRDLGDLPDGFPVVAGSIGPSHGFVHVKAINIPVNIVGLNVNPGDLVHADRHGAVVIPPEIIPHLNQAIQTLLDSEQIILSAAGGKDNFSFTDFKAAWAAFEKARI